MDSYASRFWMIILLVLAALITSTYMAMAYFSQSAYVDLKDSLYNQLLHTQKSIRLWRLQEKQALKKWVKFIETLENHQGTLKLSSPKNLLEDYISHTMIDQKEVGLILISSKKERMSFDFSMFSDLQDDFLEQDGLEPILSLAVDFSSQLIKGEAVISHPIKVKLPSAISMELVFLGIQLSMVDQGEYLIILKNTKNTVHALLDNIGLGKTGEVYLFNEEGAWLGGKNYLQSLIRLNLLMPDTQSMNGYILSNPGIDLTQNKMNNTSMIQLPLISPIVEALSGKNTKSVLEYQDFLGRKVVGAWSWDSDWKVGLVVQQSQNEALSQFFWVRKFVWTIVVTFVAILCLLTHIYLKGRQKFVTANAELLAILNNTDLPIYLLDQDDNLIDSNSSFHSLNINKSMDENSYRILKKLERQVFITRLSINEILWVFLNQQRRVLKVNLFPIVLEEENFSKYLIGGILIDVTEQFLMVEHLNSYKKHLEKRIEERTQQIQEQQARMKALLDNAPDGIATMDDHGLLLYSNDQFSKLFFINSNNSLGVYFYDLIPESREQVLSWLDDVESKIERKIEVNSGSKEHSLLIAFCPYYVSNKLFYSLTVHSVVQEKKLNKFISEPVNQNEASLKVGFLESIIKELKIPASILYEELIKKKSKDSKDYYPGRLLFAAQVVVQDLDEIKSYCINQTEALCVNRQATHIYMLYTYIIAGLLNQIRQTSVQLFLNYGYQLPKYMNLDVMKVQRVFLKLCLNTLLSLERGRLEVNLDLNYSVEGSFLILSVSTQGYGMTVDQVRWLFSSSKSVDSAFARHFDEDASDRVWFQETLDYLQGRLEVNSEPQGMCVVLTLPTEVDSIQPLLGKPKTNDFKYSRYVLFIENPHICYYIEKFLKSFDLKIIDLVDLQTDNLSECKKNVSDILLILDADALVKAEVLKSLKKIQHLPRLILGPDYCIDSNKPVFDDNEVVLTLSTPLDNIELLFLLLETKCKNQIFKYCSIEEDKQNIYTWKKENNL